MYMYMYTRRVSPCGALREVPTYMYVCNYVYVCTCRWLVYMRAGPYNVYDYAYKFFLR